MKCWQCGYDLRMNGGLRCPECGAEKGRVEQRNKSSFLVLIWAIVAGVLLAGHAFVLMGMGHGSYLPFVVYFGPVALPGIMVGLILGVPLYVAYGIILMSMRSIRQRRWGTLTIATIHYCAVVLALIVQPYYFSVSYHWTRFVYFYRDYSLLALAGLAVFLVTNVALFVYGLRTTDQ